MGVQGLIVLAIVGLAAAFLIVRLVAPFVSSARASGCHGCSTPCEVKTTAAAKQTPCADAVVPLRLVRSPADHRSR